MFTGSTKNPPPKSPQPERLDEVYAALRRGLQSYLQVHQLELDSLGQQIRESKRNGRLGFLYELDKQVKAIERFMRRLEFHLSKVEELYDAYCLQRRLRDGASKMVAAFNSASNSKEARESLSEATRGYREYTEHMCSLESELEGQMGEFHIKMKGLAGFARLCAGDQYEVLMRFGRQRWRLRGRVEVGSRQVWDSEEYVFLPLVTEMLSIKVTELKSLANHVVVGSVSCETLELFCPLPQTVAVDINNLGTVKLNLEVTWSPFDKDDQTSSASTVSKRFLSNQSPPDTPSMREQVFYSLLKRQGELENGTVWSNSSESSDDSSSPAMGYQAHRMMASHTLQTTPTIQISFTPRRSSSSTPSLTSNQEDEECDTVDGSGEVDSGKWAVPNGILQCSRSLCNISETGKDSTSIERPLAQSSSSSITRETAGQTHSEASCFVQKSEALDLAESGALGNLVPASEIQIDAAAGLEATATLEAASGEEAAAGVEATAKAEVDVKAETGNSVVTVELREGLSSKEDHQSIQPQALGKELRQPEELLTGRSHSRSSSFSQEVETALESFDFLDCSDMDDEEEEESSQDQEEEQREYNSESRSDCDGGEELEIFMEAPEGFRNCDCSPTEDDCSSPTQEDYMEHLKASIQEEQKGGHQREEKDHEEEEGGKVNDKDRDDGQEVEEEQEQDPEEEHEQKTGEEEEQEVEGVQEEEKEQEEKIQEGKEEEQPTRLGEEASCDEETQPSTSTHLATTALQP